MVAHTVDEHRQAEGENRKAAPAPVRVLIACGWLSSDDQRDSRLRIEALTRSHRLVRVTAPDGRAAVVKHSVRSGVNGRGLARELYVYRLGGWIGALADVLPAPILIDERHELLVIESLAVGAHWPDDSDLAPITSPGVAQMLGAAMAGWHRATTDIPIPPSPAAGILHMPDSLATAIDGRSASAQAFMQSVAADPTFTGALREGASSYKPSCLVHGDIRPDNWLVCRRTTELSLKVIDWELSGLGDPAWDFASACAECILHLVRSGVAVPEDSPGWPAATEPTMREFVGGYLRGWRGLVTAREDCDRIVLYAACRFLHVASEWAEYAPNVEDGLVNRIVGQARALLNARRLAAAALADWAGL